MFNPKSIFSILLYSVFFYLFVTLTSCNKENPVEPPPPPSPSIIDSNYFDWRFDTVDITIEYGMFIEDSNKIFIPGTPYLVYINNHKVNYISYDDYDFLCQCIDGTGINNVFVGGGMYSSQKSKLKRWNGNIFENIIIPNDTLNSITSIKVISESEVWLATERYKIYHYINNLFITYSVDTALTIGKIFRDNNQNLFASFYKFTNSNFDYLYMFKFENNSWLQVNKDSANKQIGIGYLIGFSNNSILRNNASSIDYFNGSFWGKYITLVDNLRPFIAGGGSPENILFQADANYQSYIIYYDGKNFYRTPNQTFPEITFNDMQYKFGRYYLSIKQDWYGRSYLGIGKFKTNNFNKYK